MSQVTEYHTDWNNINLENGVERNLNIVEHQSFDTFLLEISCNLSIINEQTVSTLFAELLESKIKCANEVFKANLDNIVKQAIKEQ
jgi:hypothetical protein